MEPLRIGMDDSAGESGPVISIAILIPKKFILPISILKMIYPIPNPKNTDFAHPYLRNLIVFANVLFW